MATEVKLPRLGQGMESGTIVRWLKSEGDPVSKREPLYELDTDKVTQEVEAEADGVLLKIFVPEGEVEVGATVAVIGAEGEEVSVPESPNGASARSTPAPAEPSDGAREPAVAGARPAPPAAGAGAPAARAGAVKASPLARRMARERGIDLAGVTGTGPDGRIVAEDVENAATGAAPAAAALAPAAEAEVITLTSTRRTIARRLTDAWQAPVFQLGAAVDMTETLALREKLVELLAEGDVKPTVNDVLTKLVAAALTRHRAVNATFDGEQVQRFAAAHVGMAVAAPNGLVVPVIRDADRRTIQEIARARADLVGRAREGKLALEDMQGGTFTISNLGMFGVEQFVAVLNPPQAAILAVGSIEDRVVARDGVPTVRPMMTMTLTCDHRAVDGATGAEFLRTVKLSLEEPGLAL
jgi:pyruvate dehydrogenase E2 component (dihydrolipoyllysine-residue acetyltransferase)